MTDGLLVGDCRETLRSLADGSVHCVITSPPYWGLRSYGVGADNGELGGEPTPEQREWIADLNEAGAEAYVWRPRDWPEIERVMA